MPDIPNARQKPGVSLIAQMSNLPRIFNQQLITASLMPGKPIDFDKIGSLIRQHPVRLFFLNSPGNPSGRVWTKQPEDEIRNALERMQQFMLTD